MTNNSIRAAFERMWQHIVLALADKLDLTSDQTATGVKTFTNGIILGENGVKLIYDDTEGAMRFTFLTAATVEEETDGEI